jgi:hypothetical protein
MLISKDLRTFHFILSLLLFSVLEFLLSCGQMPYTFRRMDKINPCSQFLCFFILSLSDSFSIFSFGVFFGIHTCFFLLIFIYFILLIFPFLFSFLVVLVFWLYLLFLVCFLFHFVVVTSCLILVLCRSLRSFSLYPLLTPLTSQPLLRMFSDHTIQQQA